MTVFGLIGYGKIGERHADHIAAHPDASLAGVFDIKEERLKSFRKNLKKPKRINRSMNLSMMMMWI